ncbi:urease accessory protein [Tranquillimonas alkanivorans]|uniref:Urease accessory protein UreF n=1 Tax=Tranquillimonas alkanivorans TaxID=441119 RepID=A0A1I5R6F3_9RHOB|nr:urease accessory protein [Tranquillimonas alkanivorans]
MTTIPRMSIEADDLTLVQWLSPAFPVGGFAYSHGLEQVIGDGAVHDAPSLEAWLTSILRDGAGLSDAVLLCAAMERDGVDAEARALAVSRERWTETAEQGAAFARTLSGMGHHADPAALPVAVGMAARSLSLPPQRVAARYLLAFAANLIHAAVRLVPLGQTDGQRVLAALQPTILGVAGQAARMMPDDITSAVPAADLAAMRHETRDVRLFKT